jgi:thiamine kinase-like enzyme
MRTRFKPTQEQRAALRAHMARVQQPTVALAILREVLPASFTPASVVCTPQSMHPDRFVLRAQVCSTSGEERVYALKAYSDEFGQQVWNYSQVLSQQHPSNGHGICLPIRYVEHERTLVFPWVEGPFLSEIVDDSKPDLLGVAARIAADLHCLSVVPEPPTTAPMFVEEALARCERTHNQWPETKSLIEPLAVLLQEAAPFLDPAQPAPIHGDMAAGQFLWTGKRLVLLDLDMFGYADPAYDVGHLLGQLERRCLWDATVQSQRQVWQDSFRETYLAVRPQVSRRNISFYRGLTLVRKIYTIFRTRKDQWPQLAQQLAASARAALEEVITPSQTGAHERWHGLPAQVRR